MTAGDTSKPPRWRSWLVSFGVPSLFVSAGLGMLGVNFWFGFALASVGFGLASILLGWLAANARQRAAKTRVLLAAGAPLLVYVVVVWVVLVPAPIDALIVSSPGNYKDGRDLGGWKWKPEYWPMTIMIQNQTGLDYTNIDVWVRTNEMVAGVGMETGMAHCTAHAAFPSMTIANPSISSMDKEGKITTIPLSLSNGTFYQIQCDKLAPKSRIDFTVAVRVDPMIARGSKEPSPPAWGALSVEYDAADRRRSTFLSECFQLRCGHRPKSIDEFRQ